jgi:SP family general alpha glucoside:H+ symporter-like MFS transporter
MANTQTTSGQEDMRIESADPGLNHLQDVSLHDKALNTAALEATVEEHSYGVWEGFKTYKRAAFWSIGTCLPTVQDSIQTLMLSQPSRAPSSWRDTT